MMTTTHKRDARTRALPAIAAALALFATPVLAQQQAPPAKTPTDTAAQPAQPAKPQPIIDLGDAKPAAAPATPRRSRSRRGSTTRGSRWAAERSSC